jgi:hypothetical protein
LPEAYPVGDDATISALMGSAAELSRPDDLIFVYVSTHGRKGSLERKIGPVLQAPLTGPALAKLLAPVNKNPSIVLLSACFSGSLINDTGTQNRIIITAASAERTSFGCAATSRHTYFGQAVLQGFGYRGKTLQQIFALIKALVAQMEQAQRKAPSDPQIFVGDGMTELYTTLVFRNS